MSTPDWVMVGSEERPGRFRIVASSSLSRSRLEYQARVRRASIAGTYTLTTEFGDMVVAEGGTYAEALRNLFNRWSPEPTPGPPGLGAGRSALTEHDEP